MSGHVDWLMLSVALALIVAGCAGTIGEIRYYALSARSRPPPGSNGRRRGRHRAP